MTPKSGYRFLDKVMLRESMTPKSGYRFLDKVMLKGDLILKAHTGFQKQHAVTLRRARNGGFDKTSAFERRPDRLACRRTKNKNPERGRWETHGGHD
jgi:hypothetical protein